MRKAFHSASPTKSKVLNQGHHRVRRYISSPNSDRFIHLVLIGEAIEGFLVLTEWKELYTEIGLSNFLSGLFSR